MSSINLDEAQEIWKPMETAPLDETPVWVRNGDAVVVASWSTEMGAWVSGLATEPNLPEGICIR